MDIQGYGANLNYMLTPHSVKVQHRIGRSFTLNTGWCLRLVEASPVPCI